MPLLSNQHVQSRDQYHDSDVKALAQMVKHAGTNGIPRDALASKFDDSIDDPLWFLTDVLAVVEQRDRSRREPLVIATDRLRNLPYESIADELLALPQ